MSYINKKKIFLINSRERTSGTDSDFMYTLDLTNNDHFTNVCLLACTLPKSYYMITADEYFTLTEDDETVDISLPEGNYSRASLKTKLTSILNSSSPKGWVYSISNPNVNQEGDDGKYTFNVTGNTTQPIFTFNDTLYEQLGFDANSVNSFVSNSPKSADVVKLQEDTLFIHSSITQSDYYISDDEEERDSDREFISDDKDDKELTDYDTADESGAEESDEFAGDEEGSDDDEDDDE